jgi:hypothetical protein
MLRAENVLDSLLKQQQKEKKKDDINLHRWMMNSE